MLALSHCCIFILYCYPVYCLALLFLIPLCKSPAARGRPPGWDEPRERRPHILPAPSTQAQQTRTAKHTLRLESPLFILACLSSLVPTFVCAISICSKATSRVFLKKNLLFLIRMDLFIFNRLDFVRPPDSSIFAYYA
jgi:hypothetical protein